MLRSTPPIERFIPSLPLETRSTLVYKQDKVADLGGYGTTVVVSHHAPSLDRQIPSLGGGVGIEGIRGFPIYLRRGWRGNLVARPPIFLFELRWSSSAVNTRSAGQSASQPASQLAPRTHSPAAWTTAHAPYTRPHVERMMKACSATCML